MPRNARNKETVFVGLSGGVDSSVAAARLRRAGSNVVGVFIKVWQPDFLTCNWEAERLDAMRVAATLKIPFHTFDAEDAYRDHVAHYMIDEYKAGRTPNPDVMCNEHVKFGVFLDYALQEGADAVATGHYAQTMEQGGVVRLLRGVDQKKDQSYFLWRLTQRELTHIRFPIGDTTKAALRREAARYGLPTATKRDSQGICFLGAVDMEEFLAHYITPKPGTVLDEEGRRIGEHRGAFFYTIGQRHGFSVTTDDAHARPYYVVKKDIEHNTITVSHEPPISVGATLTLGDLSFTHTPPKVGEAFSIMTRYRETPHKATVTAYDGAILTLSASEELTAPTVGQSCVLYTGNECRGGGIINGITE